MDFRGQASSVFQLLISAVVALAILMILFSVLGVINFGVNTEPAKAAADVLKEAYNSPASVKTQPKVTFNSSQKEINLYNLAKSSKIGINEEQICLLAGAYQDNETLFTLTDYTLTYNGSGSKDVGLAAFCYSNNQLATTIENVSPVLSGYYNDGACCSNLDSESDELCCFIALTTPKS